MHGYVKCERLVKRKLGEHRSTLPAELVAWAESSILYCNAFHESAKGDPRTSVRKAKVEALKGQLRGVLQALDGVACFVGRV